MVLSRRDLVKGALASGAFAAMSGSARAEKPSKPRTKLYVLGTIHSTHRTSEKYSLAVLERAIRAASPDRLLTEIPPDRIAEAYRSFRETGRVTEPRTVVFPEYVDVAFPLTREMDFEIIPTAGWTRDIADNRRAALRRIENDPARADQWSEHRAAYAQYSRDLQGRGDDPMFIHTDKYDALVERAQSPYQNYFDADLGAGGWTQINAAHTALINKALDEISGRGLTAMATFGSWHKYMILNAIAGRRDIELGDARELFS